MERIKSLSDKRLVIAAEVNGKLAYFLLDSGASVGLMDDSQRRDYDLVKGRRYNGTLVGAGGEMNNVYHCNTFVYIEDRTIPQFLLADISDVVNSIERQTGIKILGIISLPQMKMCNISIDCNDNEIILE